MKIAREACPDKQLSLFEKDRRIGSIGSARYHTGQVVEQVAANVLDAKMLVTSTEFDICPDLQLRACGSYVESKASGCNNQVILYEQRCKKYDQFIADGHQLYYFVLKHTLRFADISWLSQLRRELERCAEFCFLVPADAVHRVVYDKPVRVVNGAHSNDLYHLGWTVSVSELKPYAEYIEFDLFSFLE